MRHHGHHEDRYIADKYTVELNDEYLKTPESLEYISMFTPPRHYFDEEHKLFLANRLEGWSNMDPVTAAAKQAALALRSASHAFLHALLSTHSISEKCVVANAMYAYAKALIEYTFALHDKSPDYLKITLENDIVDAKKKLDDLGPTPFGLSLNLNHKPKFRIRLFHITYETSKLLEDVKIDLAKDTMDEIGDLSRGFREWSSSPFLS